MFRAISHGLAAVLFLLATAPLMAGGPPVVFLPVDGVTAENAPACAKLVKAKLGERFGSKSYDVTVLERSGTWHIAFPFEKDVRLSDFTSALKGSPYSISTDDLHLFGHVILEVDATPASAENILSGLKAISNVALEDSKSEVNTLRVTLDMPYPVGEWRPGIESVTWSTFQRNDFSKNAAHNSVGPQELPTYQQIREAVSANDAKVTDLRWSPDFWCRPLGGIKASSPSEEVAKGK